MSEVLSPATQKPVRLTDTEIGASYIEFPEDTFFLESLSQNTTFRSGVAYIPAQRFIDGKEETHLYEIRPGVTHALHVAGPVAAPDGSNDVTVFGSALTSKGILYLCAFNRNSIIALNLNELPEKPGPVKCFSEIGGLSSPNDVAVDPDNEAILYVAGGTFRHFCCSVTFSNAALGKVYKVVMSDASGTGDATVSINAKGLNTLAGLEVFNAEIWIAQLFDIVKQKGDGKPRSIWEGNDGEGTVWLADNVDLFEENVLLCPAYSTVPEGTVNNVLNRTSILSAGVFFAQIATACMRCENLSEALLDPEVSLSFSNTYIKEGDTPAPIRLIFLKPGNSPPTAYHFEIDLVGARAENEPRTIFDREDKTKKLGKRHFFNEQVTHAAHLKDEESGEGYVACVNFEQPRILLLKDKPFCDAMS